MFFCHEGRLDKPDHALHMIEQRLHDPQDDLISCGLILISVKTNNEITPRLALSRGFSPFADNLSQWRQIDIRTSGKNTSDIRVNRCSKIEQIRNELDVEGRHHGATPVIQRDKALTLQHKKSLANWQSRDPQLGSERILGNFAAGHETAFEDGSANLVRHICDNRFSLNRFHWPPL